MQEIHHLRLSLNKLIMIEHTSECILLAVIGEFVGH